MIFVCEFYFALNYILMLEKFKVPPWSVHGMSFNSLNEVEGFLDLIDFLIRLQAIVDRKEILWASMMPSFFQIILCLFV